MCYIPRRTLEVIVGTSSLSRNRRRGVSNCKRIFEIITGARLIAADVLKRDRALSIPEEIIERIRDRISISELVSESVSLKRTGKNFVGLCPFHKEKSPSFSVSDDHGSFRCFGCGKHGSIFDFIMLTRGLTFVEAVHLLGKRAGVEVPDTRGARPESDEMKRERVLLKSVLRDAAAFFHQTLLTDRAAEKAREYLASRKLNDETIRRFQIGWAPERDSLVARLGESDSSEDPNAGAEIVRALVTSGLVTRKSDGTQYDTFRGRVVFPISKSDSSVVAFGGRLLANVPNRPKYINSVESPLYSKRKSLFGLAQALDLMRTTREVFLVEGYMDVVALHQLGITNTVAAILATK